MRLFIPKHIQTTEVDGQWVLLDCRKNRYYAVNRTGAEFLKQIELYGEMTKAIEIVSKIYQTPSEKVKQDMIRFANHLIEKGLLVKG